MVTPTYQPRDPSDTVLYRVIADHLETFLAGIDADPTGKGLPSYVREEFDAYLQCGILAHRRDQLERLIRYTARGAVSLERLGQDASGDLIYTFTRPWSDGTTGIKLSPLELLEKLAALVPPPRVHQVRYGGCLAPHSKLRGVITPTCRQQGVEPAASPVSSRWGWVRLLKRVFAIDLERCPTCHQGTLRIIAAITSGPIIRKILYHLKLAADPPPIAPARLSQERFA